MYLSVRRSWVFSFFPTHLNVSCRSPLHHFVGSNSRVASDGNFGPTNASFPAPENKYIPPSVVRWQPRKRDRDDTGHDDDDEALAPDLAQLFSFVMGQERSETLKSGVDTLHSTTFVRIGNLATNLLFLVDRRTTIHTGKKKTNDDHPREEGGKEGGRLSSYPSREPKIISSG